MKQMIDSGAVMKLSAAIEKLQGGIHAYKEVADVFQVSRPELDAAENEAKAELATVCTVTSLRILTSKSAQLLSNSLQPSVATALAYATDNDLSQLMPEGILERLSKLRDDLEDASSAPKKRRTL